MFKWTMNKHGWTWHVFIRGSRQQVYGSLTEHLFFIKIQNQVRFVDTLFYSRLISSIHQDCQHVDCCVISQLEYKNRAAVWGVCEGHLVRLWTFCSSGLFSFHLIGGIDHIYKIIQILLVFQPLTNSSLWHTIIMGYVGL